MSAAPKSRLGRGLGGLISSGGSTAPKPEAVAVSAAAVAPGYQEIAATSQPQHFDQKIEPGTTYYYVLRAEAGAEVSPNSEEKAIPIPGEKKKAVAAPTWNRTVAQDQWDRLLRALKDHRSLDYAHRRAVEFAERAKRPLQAFPPSSERDALLAERNSTTSFILTHRLSSSSRNAAGSSPLARDAW